MNPISLNESITQSKKMGKSRRMGVMVMVGDDNQNRVKNAIYRLIQVFD